VASQFVLVRLTRISGSDLNLFEFDYDLNFMVFFLNANEKIYGRYGGRDGKSAEGKLSLAGLRYALKAALDAHRKEPGDAPSPPGRKPLYVDDYPGAKRLRKGTCIHCHQVYEFRREFEKNNGSWSKDSIWRFPLPENVGLTLDNDQGDRVQGVTRGSPAERVGLKAGDVLESLNGYRVSSFGDAQYALHRAPVRGEISVIWKRDGKSMRGNLTVVEGWRRSNITWRPSLLDILISPSLFGDDLSVREKKALGLGEKRLAFRQDRPIPKDLAAIGLRPEDVVTGINSQELEMTMLEFLAHLRRNHVVGERITLNVLRDGKKVDLPLTLR
jgi:serine protease Do